MKDKVIYINCGKLQILKKHINLIKNHILHYDNIFVDHRDIANYLKRFINKRIYSPKDYKLHEFLLPRNYTGGDFLSYNQTTFSRIFQRISETYYKIINKKINQEEFNDIILPYVRRTYIIEIESRSIYLHKVFTQNPDIKQCSIIDIDGIFGPDHFFYEAVKILPISI